MLGESGVLSVEYHHVTMRFIQSVSNPLAKSHLQFEREPE